VTWKGVDGDEMDRRELFVFETLEYGLKKRCIQFWLISNKKETETTNLQNFFLIVTRTDWRRN
jgi:hypothetical protein